LAVDFFLAARNRLGINFTHRNSYITAEQDKMSVDPERLRNELARIRQLIAEDPRVLAKFDTDGNGIIDGEEWAEVRRVVIQRIEREDQEAEMARMFADEEDTSEARPEPVAERDFSGLELAFDPRQEREVASIADDLFRRDLSREYADGAQTNGTSMADHQELILEQVGGLKQLFGNMFKRQYRVLDAHKRELGRISQRQNEMLQNMMDYSIFTDPDLSFVVEDDLCDERREFVRTTGMTENSMQIKNPRGRYIGYTEWKLSFLRRKYEVRMGSETTSYYVRRRLLKPWTYDVLDAFDEPIGTMERGWAGLGFLAGANLFHIDIEVDVSNDLMWGFLATALLADLDGESHSRRSGLDFLNS